jgi:NDP-sugar pyrophosphorylase family protein
MSSPTLLVLAAGMGSRYGGLKQIDSVGPGGETIIDYSIYDALRADFGRLIFVIRHEIEQAFRETVGVRFENRIAIEYAYQELNDLPAEFSVPPGRTKPWGTTQAILAATGLIHEPFAVINADDFYGADSYRVLAQHLQSSDDYAMVGFTLRNTLSDFGTVARGVCKVNGAGFLDQVVELTGIAREGSFAVNTDSSGQSTQLTGDELVSMNMWGFTPTIFAQLQQEFRRFLERSGSDAKSESYLPSAVNELVVSHQTRIRVLRTSDAWFGVTYREDRARVVEGITRLIEAGAYPERLWS